MKLTLGFFVTDPSQYMEYILWIRGDLHEFKVICLHTRYGNNIDNLTKILTSKF